LWIKRRYRDNYLWQGHRVKVIDGTGMSMPDTDPNRRQWPYAGQQKPGCGFPVAQLVGVFCLGTGRLVKFAISAWKNHEIALARQLIGWVHPGEVLLADRGFCGWGLIALFGRKGVPVVFRLHQARKDKHGISRWKKPRCPQTWERCLWRELPAELVLRIVRFEVEIPGFRTRRIVLATTLLDTARYPDNALIALYMRRWRIELFYKNRHHRHPALLAPPPPADQTSQKPSPHPSHLPPNRFRSSPSSSFQGRTQCQKTQTQKLPVPLQTQSYHDRLRFQT
jgi:hypothetical protein